MSATRRHCPLVLAPHRDAPPGIVIGFPSGPLSVVSLFPAYTQACRLEKTRRSDFNEFWPDRLRLLTNARNAALPSTGG
jgi:hypothetical protein